MRKFAISMAVLVAAIGVSGIGGAKAQATQSIWDGVYTTAQATRGSTQYFRHCAVCHATNLSGTYETPPLVGQFMPDWAGSTLNDLFEYIRTAMPLDHPDSLGSAAYADIVAFLLKQNGLPAGQSELRAGSDLKSIAFDIVRPPSSATSPKLDRRKATK